MVERFMGIGKRWRASEQAFITQTRGLSPLETDQGIVWKELVIFQEGSPPEKAKAAYILTHYLRKYGRRVHHIYQERVPVSFTRQTRVVKDAMGIPVGMQAAAPQYKYQWRKREVDWNIVTFLNGFPQPIVDVILTAPVELMKYMRQARQEVKETGESEIGKALVQQDPGLREEIYGEALQSSDPLTGPRKKKRGRGLGQSTVILLGTVALGLMRLYRG